MNAEALAQSEAGTLELYHWMIAYYYKIDPRTLSDREFANALAFLMKIRKMEKKATEGPVI